MKINKGQLILTYIIILLNLNIVFSQKEVLTVEGYFETEFNNNETKDQAKKRAKEGAIINALEKAFGIAVFQGNTLFLKNVVTGQKVESFSSFNSIGETFVKGEVVEEEKVDFDEFMYEKKILDKISHGIIIKCKVIIKAREYIEPTANFTAYTLNCSDTSHSKTNSFKKKDDFFVFFNTPQDGYLCVFLDDNQSSSILFPYSTGRSKYFNGFPVASNKDYLLFSNEKKYSLGDNIITDELEWDSRENLEKLIIIFSTKPFELPDLNRSKSNEIPEMLHSEDFNKWLIHLRNKNKNVEIKKIIVDTILSQY